MKKRLSELREGKTAVITAFENDDADLTKAILNSSSLIAQADWIFRAS